jgi:hypothetical protein
MRFSQRIGKSPVREVVQIDGIDERLKTRLWFIINERFIFRLTNHARYGQTTDRSSVLYQLWIDFFVRRHDHMPQYESREPNLAGIIEELKEWYFDIAQWYEIYDLIEFLVQLNGFNETREFIDLCNIVLKKELSAYRIIDRTIVKITSDEEIESIEEALSSSDSYKAVNTHLSSALELLANRESPNYRNSVKESISAVEALCKLIVNDPKVNTLGKALAVLEREYKLHGSLKEAYTKLYGYTSDAQGIRHALLDDQEIIDFEDAKFMLVSCCAFVNYLKAKLKL